MADKMLQVLLSYADQHSRVTFRELLSCHAIVGGDADRPLNLLDPEVLADVRAVIAVIRGEPVPKGLFSAQARVALGAPLGAVA